MDEPSLASMVNMHDPKVQAGMRKLMENLPKVPQQAPTPFTEAEHAQAAAAGVPSHLLGALEWFDTLEEAIAGLAPAKPTPGRKSSLLSSTATGGTSTK